MGRLVIMDFKFQSDSINTNVIASFVSPIYSFKFQSDSINTRAQLIQFEARCFPLNSNLILLIRASDVYDEENWPTLNSNLILLIRDMFELADPIYKPLNSNLILLILVQSRRRESH